MPPAHKPNGPADDHVTPVIRKMGSDLHAQRDKLDLHLEAYAKDRKDVSDALTSMKDGIEALTKTVETVNSTVNGYEATIRAVRKFIWRAAAAISLAFITGAAGVIGSSWYISHTQAPQPSAQYIVQQKQQNDLIMKRLDELSARHVVEKN
jgi:prophage DNA circulation protein